MKKINNWILTLVALIILISAMVEAIDMHDSGLLIASVTILALVLWFMLISFCVICVARILT